MRRNLSCLLPFGAAAAAALCLGSAATAQPANDLCANAQGVAIPSSTAGTLVSAPHLRHHLCRHPRGLVHARRQRQHADGRNLLHRGFVRYQASRLLLDQREPVHQPGFVRVRDGQR